VGLADDGVILGDDFGLDVLLDLGLTEVTGADDSGSTVLGVGLVVTG
jgi:hypothetical protein